MAKEEGNVGCRADEDFPSTSEEDLLRADATGVITWLRFVGEFSTYAFWKEFSFPPNIRVSFPPPGPHYVDCTD